MDISTIINIILCVLSFLLATISVITVVITLRQNNKMIEESTRPVISVYTDKINAGDPHFYIIIKNFGRSSAYITKFEYDFDFKDCYEKSNDNESNNKKLNDKKSNDNESNNKESNDNKSNNKDYLKEINNAVIAPGQSRICKLEFSKINKEVTFTLEYHSGAKKIYSDKFTIDLKAGVDMLHPKVSTAGKELRTISYVLQEMLQKNL